MNKYNLGDMVWFWTERDHLWQGPITTIQLEDSLIMYRIDGWQEGFEEMELYKTVDEAIENVRLYYYTKGEYAGTKPCVRYVAREKSE